MLDSFLVRDKNANIDQENAGSIKCVVVASEGHWAVLKPEAWQGTVHCPCVLAGQPDRKLRPSRWVILSCSTFSCQSSWCVVLSHPSTQHACRVHLAIRSPGCLSLVHPRDSASSLVEEFDINSSLPGLILSPFRKYLFTMLPTSTSHFVVETVKFFDS